MLDVHKYYYEIILTLLETVSASVHYLYILVVTIKRVLQKIVIIAT